MRVSWDFEVKELINGGMLYSAAVLNKEHGNLENVILSQKGGITVSNEEAAAIILWERQGVLAKQMLTCDDRSYVITTVNKHTMYGRFVPLPNSLASGGVVVCRFPTAIALLFYSGSKYLPSSLCESWTKGILSLMV